MKLNIQSIKTAEMLLGKPFGDFDFDSENDVDILAYAVMLTDSPEVFTYETYKRLPTKIKMKAFKLINSQLSFLAQFGKENTEAGEKNESKIFLGEIAADLIMEGMDAHYVLYEMQLFELQDYIKALDKKIKTRMENDRLWTYFTILPHVDTRGNKMQSPRDLLTFAWELEEERERKEREYKSAEAKFWEFINGEPLKQ